MNTELKSKSIFTCFLNHLLTLTIHKRVLVCCLWSYSTNREFFPKFALFMDPLGAIVPAPINKKSLFGVFTYKKMIWCNLLVTCKEVWIVRAPTILFVCQNSICFVIITCITRRTTKYVYRALFEIIWNFFQGISIKVHFSCFVNLFWRRIS